MWRVQDQALLERLEDEQTLEALWRAEAPGAPPLHPRAAGLVHVLRAHVDTSDLDAVQRAVRPKSLAGLPAELLHHIAIYNARLAKACDHDAERVEAARLCSLAAWIALAHEGEYLERLAKAVLGADGAIDEAVRAAAIAPLDALGAEAQAGARDLSLPAQQALRALAHVSDACRISGCSAVLTRRFEKHADRLRAAAIESALAPIREAISDATARGRAEVEGGELMARVASVWRWADADEHVERFAVDVVTPIAWNVYHEENSDAALRRLIVPLESLVDRLAWRIADDPSRIAYAAPCAQMFVFRSEMSTLAADRQRWAERSLEICPSHRNGRLILASLLVHEVRDRIDRAALFMQASDFSELHDKLVRAEELYPRTRGLDDLKQKLADLRDKSWWSR